MMALVGRTEAIQQLLCDRLRPQTWALQPVLDRYLDPDAPAISMRALAAALGRSESGLYAALRQLARRTGRFEEWRWRTRRGRPSARQAQ